MGKWTDKLYITRTECESGDYYGARSAKSRPAREALEGQPLDLCSLTLQPWRTPVCTPQGIIYDKVAIIDALRDSLPNGRDPLTGATLQLQDLIDLKFPNGTLCCPITGKSFLEPHLGVVAIATSGHVYAQNAIHELLSMSPECWRDPCTDVPFRRGDLIQLQPRLAIPAHVATTWDDTYERKMVHQETAPLLPPPLSSSSSSRIGRVVRISLRFVDYGDLHCELIVPHDEAKRQCLLQFVQASLRGLFERAPCYRLVPGGFLQLGHSDRRDLLAAAPPSPAGTHDSAGILGLVHSRPGRYVAHLYVTLGTYPSLDGMNLSLGRVVAGWNILERLQNAPVDSRSLTPTKPIILEDVIVVENPFEPQ
jgi:cyclophilin family peptidyl-prolyl cis-trans isomerase